MRPGGLPFAARALYEEDLAAVRTRLGDAALAAAWAEGQGMTLDQAILFALSDPQ